MSKLRSILQTEFSTIGEDEFVRLFAAKKRMKRDGAVPLKESAGQRRAG